MLSPNSLFLLRLIYPTTIHLKFSVVANMSIAKHTVGFKSFIPR
jgi:hypothetical protein